MYHLAPSIHISHCPRFSGHGIAEMKTIGKLILDPKTTLMGQLEAETEETRTLMSWGRPCCSLFYVCWCLVCTTFDVDGWIGCRGTEKSSSDNSSRVGSRHRQLRRTTMLPLMHGPPCVKYHVFFVALRRLALVKPVRLRERTHKPRGPSSRHPRLLFSLSTSAVF